MTGYIFIGFVVLIVALVWTTRRRWRPRPVGDAVQADQTPRVPVESLDGYHIDPGWAEAVADIAGAEPNQIRSMRVAAGFGRDIAWGQDDPESLIDIHPTPETPLPSGELKIDADALRDRVHQQTVAAFGMTDPAESEAAFQMARRATSPTALTEMVQTAFLPRYDDHPPPIDDTPDRPRGWKNRTAWMAVRSASAHAVASALEITDTQSCNWQSGVEFGHWDGYGLGEDQSQFTVFVTPPVDGWVLVLQDWSAAESRAVCRSIMAPLSRQFGEVQAFFTHRTSAAFGWARAQDGELTRQTSWIDEQIDNFGKLTDGEAQLWREITGREPPDTSEEFVIRFEFDEPHPHDLARHWSVDPRTFDTRDDLQDRHELGIAGLRFPPDRDV